MKSIKELALQVGFVKWELSFWTMDVSDVWSPFGTFLHYYQGKLLRSFRTCLIFCLLRKCFKNGWSLLPLDQDVPKPVSRIRAYKLWCLCSLVRGVDFCSGELDRIRLSSSPVETICKDVAFKEWHFPRYAMVLKQRSCRTARGLSS